MLLNKNPYNSEHDVEFMLERPIGWSSACLDSTIDYYLNYNNNSATLESQKNDTELRKESI